MLLHARARGAAQWEARAAALAGRRTWQATLGLFAAETPVVEYYVSAMAGSHRVATETFRVTVL